MARFQILSLAGGGIRGAYITSFLNDLEQKLGQPIAESFDLIAGTSTGGIIAAGLALGLPASAMHDFYVRHGAGIFAQRPPYRAHGLMRLLTHQPTGYSNAERAVVWTRHSELAIVTMHWKQHSRKVSGTRL